MSGRNLYNTYCEDESKYCSIKKNTNQAKIIELCNNNDILNADLSNSLLILYESDIGIIGDINLFALLEIADSKPINDFINKNYIVDVHIESLGNIEFFFDYVFYSNKNIEIKSDTWFKRLSLIDTNNLQLTIAKIKSQLSTHLKPKMLDNANFFLQKYFELILQYNLNTGKIIKILEHLNFKNNAISDINKNKLVKLEKKLNKKIDEEDNVDKNKTKLEIVKKGLALFYWKNEFKFEISLSEEFANKIIYSTSSIIDKILEPFSGKSDFVFNICSGPRIDMLIPVFVLKHITQELEIKDADSINRFSIISFCKQEYNQYESVFKNGVGGSSFNSILFEYLNNDNNILSIIKTYNPRQNINDENRQKLLSIIRSRLNIYYISSGKDILGIYNFFFPILYKKLYQKQLITDNQPIFIHVGFITHGSYNNRDIGKILYLIEKEYNFVFYGTNFIVYPNKSLYKRTLENSPRETCKIDGKSCYPDLKIGNKDYNEGIYTILTKDATVEFYE